MIPSLQGTESLVLWEECCYLTSSRKLTSSSNSILTPSSSANSGYPITNNPILSFKGLLRSLTFLHRDNLALFRRGRRVIDGNRQQADNAIKSRSGSTAKFNIELEQEGNSLNLLEHSKSSKRVPAFVPLVPNPGYF
jgi:hypothetical protein